MTPRQQLLKFIYPLSKMFGKWKDGNDGILNNINEADPGTSFYSLSAQLIDGSPFHFKELKGKKVLLVNVASDCGYTPQYEHLEKLNLLYQGKLAILAFPGNDFKQQEPESDKNIAEFCRSNYGVTFPLFKKNPVTGPLQQEVFQWLSQKNKNGWNNQPPGWNFCKYLVDGNGRLQYFFAPYVSPLGKEMTRAIGSISGFS